ncbi:hypothetical protein CMO91_04275 [Candidatus Woesearchaeota archaeon]|nr:hypothetical protein [Candidatus Woesearchaeota archaeon]
MAVVIHHQPERAFPLTDLTCSFRHEHVKPDFTEYTDEMSQALLDKVDKLAELGKDGGGLDNNLLLHMDNFHVGTDHLELSFAEFADQEKVKLFTQGKKGRTHIDPLFTYFNVLSSIIFMTTSDGYSVWGFRGGGKDAHLSGRYLPLAGFCTITHNPKEKADFIARKSSILEASLGDIAYIDRHARGELYEEGGLEHLSAEDSLGGGDFLGFTGHTIDSPLSCIVLHYNVDATREEVDHAWGVEKNDENTHLIYLRNSEMMSFAAQQHSGVVNPFRDVRVDGPKLSVDGKEREWYHIENGLAAVILYVSTHMGLEQGNQAAQAIRDSGHVVANVHKYTT